MLKVLRKGKIRGGDDTRCLNVCIEVFEDAEVMPD